MDIQTREALITEINNFKKEALKMHIVEVLAKTYEHSSLFDCNIDVDGSVIWYKAQARQLWDFWKAAKAQAVPEGFVLVPTKNVKFFSHDGENYEVHDTLSGAKHEAKCAIQHYEDMLADQTTDPRSDGNFSQVGYGIVLAESGYSIDHVVTQKDVDKGDYSYEVGTEIMSLFLVEAQEQN